MSLFHIHVDAAWITSDFEAFLKHERGFFRADFVGSDCGRAEPLHHLTFKTGDAQEFRRTFAMVRAYAQSNQAMGGYLEGEVVYERDYPLSEYDANVSAPFKLEMTL